jgi:hypothetical protein
MQPSLQPSRSHLPTSPPQSKTPHQHVDHVYVTTTSSFANLHHGWFRKGRGSGLAHIVLRQGYWKNAIRLARARWRLLKIVTDVVGVIESLVPLRPQLVWNRSKQRPFLPISRGGYQQRSAWDIVQLRMRPGQWRKSLTSWWRSDLGWAQLTGAHHSFAARELPVVVQCGQ